MTAVFSSTPSLFSQTMPEIFFQVDVITYDGDFYSYEIAAHDATEAMQMATDMTPDADYAMIRDWFD